MQRHAGAMALLALTALVAASGWATLNERGGEVMEDVHELLANAMLGLVLVHVAAVILSSRLHRENLVRAMIDGRKTGAPEQGIARQWAIVACLLLAAVLGFWWLQWQTAPASAPPADAAIHARQGED